MPRGACSIVQIGQRYDTTMLLPRYDITMVLPRDGITMLSPRYDITMILPQDGVSDFALGGCQKFLGVHALQNFFVLLTLKCFYLHLRRPLRLG